MEQSDDDNADGDEGVEIETIIEYYTSDTVYAIAADGNRVDFFH